LLNLPILSKALSVIVSIYFELELYIVLPT